MSLDARKLHLNRRFNALVNHLEHQYRELQGNAVEKINAAPLPQDIRDEMHRLRKARNRISHEGEGKNIPLTLPELEQAESWALRLEKYFGLAPLSPEEQARLEAQRRAEAEAAARAAADRQAQQAYAEALRVALATPSALLTPEQIQMVTAHNQALQERYEKELAAYHRSRRERISSRFWKFVLWVGFALAAALVLLWGYAATHVTDEVGGMFAQIITGLFFTVLLILSVCVCGFAFLAVRYSDSAWKYMAPVGLALFSFIVDTHYRTPLLIFSTLYLLAIIMYFPDFWTKPVRPQLKSL